MKELVYTGMSKLKAAKIMAEETGGEISADTIRKRFDYYTVKSKGNSVGKTSNKVGSEIGKTSNEVDTDIGQTSHPQELCNSNISGKLCIPLETNQHELVTALADFFINKKVNWCIVENTLQKVRSLVAHLMC